MTTTKSLESLMVHINLDAQLPDIIFSDDKAIIKSDESYLEEMIRKEPLKNPSYFRQKASKENQEFTLIKIGNCLQKVRDELFPREREVIFSKEYCKTIEKEGNSSSYCMYQVRQQILLNDGSKNKNLDEFITFYDQNIG